MASACDDVDSDDAFLQATPDSQNLDRQSPDLENEEEEELICDDHAERVTDTPYQPLNAGTPIGDFLALIPRSQGQTSPGTPLERDEERSTRSTTGLTLRPRHLPLPGRCNLCCRCYHTQRNLQAQNMDTEIASGVYEPSRALPRTYDLTLDLSPSLQSLLRGPISRQLPTVPPIPRPQQRLPQRHRPRSWSLSSTCPVTIAWTTFLLWSKLQELLLLMPPLLATD
eukprot:s2999_g7.t1